MTCSGKNAFSGAEIEITFEKSIERVVSTGDFSGVYLAPAWIDLQVNGFAGADYNDPSLPHEAIAHSVRALFATGVARFYPTVITGAPERMEAALRNLAAAKA